jgi:hypothetical protein
VSDPRTADIIAPLSQREIVRQPVLEYPPADQSGQRIRSRQMLLPDKTLPQSSQQQPGDDKKPESDPRVPDGIGVSRYPS